MLMLKQGFFSEQIGISGLMASPRGFLNAYVVVSFLRTEICLPIEDLGCVSSFSFLLDETGRKFVYY